jgi:putative colanic acid biosysnthesis UDP-glucose lipid carrier transferase
VTIDSMRERVEHDLHYIRHWSIWSDVRILIKTVHHVIKRSNAY